MDAKGLIEAATRLRERYSDWRYVESGSLYGQDVIVSCDHILATVRPDDDEPVTRERLEADGWFRRSIRYRHWETQFSVVEKYPELIAEFENGQQICRLKSMGHLRRLVAALGE